MKPSVEILSTLEAISPLEWDTLVSPNDPFCTHAFLSTLETSGSVGQQSGWLPCHIIIREGERLVAAMPLYLKDNSYGEYIFDWGWAEASERAGIPYYPKLVCAVPFTPATGSRLLIHPDEDAAHWKPILVNVAKQVADQTNAHSIHWLCTDHPTPPDDSVHRRETLQFHWHNPQVSTFEEWLSKFKTKDRKKIRAERRKAKQGVDQIQCVHGKDLTDTQIATIWNCYQDTTMRKWGRPYLQHGFFASLNTTLASLTRVFFAYKDQQIVAVSLCFERGQHLYGRYWGCLEDIDSLHFELCYHAPIEYCLEHGLQKFEAGAQGEHKLKRGLLATSVHSWHWLEHPGLHHGVGEFLQEEIAVTQQNIHAYNAHSPLKS